MFVTNSFLFHKTLRLAAGGGAFAFTSSEVDIRRLNALAATRQTYAVATQSAGLRRSTRIGAVTRAVALATPAVALKRQLRLGVGTEGMTVTGEATQLQKSRVSGFVATEYAIDGQATLMRRNLLLSVESAPLDAAGHNVGMLKVAGSIAVDPVDAFIEVLEASLRHQRLLGSVAAAVAVTGRAAALKRGYPMPAVTSALAITGRSAALRMARRLAAVKSSFNVAFPSQTLTYIPSDPDMILIASAGVSSGATLNIPTSGVGGAVQEGDFALFIDWSWTGSSTVDVFPTGWATFINNATPNTERMHVGYKNLEAADIGGTVTGINGTTNSSKLLLIYRRKDGGNVPRFGDVTFATPTGSDPGALDITPPSQLPVLVIGVAASTQTTASFTQAPTTALALTEGGGNRIKAHLDIYNRGDTPVTHNYNQGDQGGNAPWGAFLQLMKPDECVDLLLRGGANGSTTFADSSLYGRTVTRGGNVVNSNAQSKYGGTSILFDGTGDYLTMDSQRDEFNVHDYTMELWLFRTALGSGNPCLMDTRSGSGGADPVFRYATSGSFQFHVDDAVRASITLPPVNEWHHAAITRKAGITKFWFDGVQVGSNYTTLTRFTSRSLTLGTWVDQRNTAASDKFPGYLDNIRIINGVSAYNAAFTPADVPTPAGNLN